MVTLAVAGPFCVLGVLGPWLAPEDGIQIHLGGALAGPSGAHPLGTDYLGRDELSRMLIAARSSLEIVLVVLVTALLLGALVGVVAGWRGGLLDTVLMRVVDVMVGIPQFLLALVLLGVLGTGLVSVMIALAAGGWMAYARLVRTEVMVRRHEPMVEALWLLGARPWRILTRHVLPAVLVLLSTEAGTTVINVATLSFLGLGVPPPTPEWGGMVVEARPYLQSAPWLFLLPAAAITLVVVALNLVAERPARWFAASRGTRPADPAPGGDRGFPLTVTDLAVCLDTATGQRRVVDGVSFTVARGETLALVGESGSGKTMCTAGLIGLLPGRAAVTGSAQWEGRELVGRSERELRRVRGGGIALIPQELHQALNPLRKVGQQIAEAARLHTPMTRADAAAEARRLLGTVGIDDPERVAGQRPDQLSGGMRQRVLIAAALAGRPRLLIADEPTSALDVVVAARLIALLALLRDSLGLSMILVTHDFGVVAGLADQVAVLDGGRVVEHGSTREVLTAPRHPVTRALVAAVPQLGAPPPAGGPAPVSVSVGRPLLRVRGAQVRFGAVPALRGVDLEVAHGTAVGVVGASGCGKTTLARAIVGLRALDAGHIELAAEAGRAQLVHQHPSAALDPRRPVGAALDEALLLGGTRSGGQRERRARQLLEQVGLDPALRTRLPSQLSGGQRQRVVIARALTANPRLLVLDEPVSSLDVSVRAGILELLTALRSDGVALVVISHDLAVLERLVDRVLVMSEGRIVDSGPTRELLTDPAHPVTRELIEAVPRLQRARY
jgi:peptide/nickel transport system permease protein